MGTAVDTDSRLHSVIEDLYHVFARYPLGTLQAGPPWLTQEEVDQVQVKPLRELGGDDLGNFACSALTTMGDADTFRHFLPRLLELVALDDGVGGCDTEIVISKLRYAQWQQWESREKAAITDYLHRLWQHFLESVFLVEENLEHAWYTWDYVGQSTDSMLCTVAQAEGDLRPYFADWLQSSSPYSVGYLAGLITHYYAKRRLAENKLRVEGAFWRQCPDQAKQVTDWLVSDLIVRHLETFFFADSDHVFSSNIAESIDCLTLLQRQPGSF